MFSCKSLGKPLQKIITFFIDTVFLKLYKIHLFFYKYIKRFLEPLQDWIFAPFTAKIFIHIVIILISFVVVIDNINAQVTRDDETSLKSRNNFIYKLTSKDEFTLIEEKASDKIIIPTFSYLDSSESQPYVSNQERINTLLAQNNQVALLTGDDTMVKPSITSTVINFKLRDKIENYTVLSGDTIGAISEKFGLNLTTLLWANNLTVRSYIKPGDALIIPPTNGIIHKVKTGETLAAISKKYQAETDKVLAFNKLVAANEIQIGQELMIPDGQRPAPVVIRRKTVTPKVNIPTTYEETTPTYNNSDTGTKLLWPTDWNVITQYYSWRHTGVDLDGDYNSRNYASADGTVIKAQGGWNGGYGLYIIIDHGGGLQTLYAHNSKLFVKVGDHVKRGQVIAMMGSTGRSTGTHIHYEVRVNGTRVNPLRYVR